MDPSCMPGPDDLELAEKHIEELYQRIAALEQQVERWRQEAADLQQQYKVLMEDRNAECDKVAALEQQAAKDREDRESDVTCPFCGETGFDLVGLKGHLLGGVFAGPCDAYEAVDDDDEGEGGNR